MRVPSSSAVRKGWLARCLAHKAHPTLIMKGFKFPGLYKAQNNLQCQHTSHDNVIGDKLPACLPATQVKASPHEPQCYATRACQADTANASQNKTRHTGSLTAPRDS